MANVKEIDIRKQKQRTEKTRNTVCVGMSF